jgi:pimeloyl-ACP methyl ester carboxylesterase
VFGTSGGAIIALKLATRAPEVARDVIVHEPPFLQVLPDGAELGRTFQAQVEQALASRGARGATELFVRENAGSDVFDRLDPALRERMIANGPTFFGHELAMFMSWIPSETELAGLRVPVRMLAGRDNRGHYYYRAAQWLAKALGIDLIEIPGAHAPYLAHPGEFAAALLPLLNRELERAM